MSDDHDPVNHPAHYIRGGIEAIDVVEAFELDFLLGSVVTYVLRANFKGNALQDLQKARWFLDRAIKNLAELQKAKP